MDGGGYEAEKTEVKGIPNYRRFHDLTLVRQIKNFQCFSNPEG